MRLVIQKPGGNEFPAGRFLGGEFHGSLNQSRKFFFRFHFRFAERIIFGRKMKKGIFFTGKILLYVTENKLQCRIGGGFAQSGSGVS